MIKGQGKEKMQLTVITTWLFSSLTNKSYKRPGSHGW